MRILILSHGHPELSPGGGERAAYALFERLKQTPGIARTVFAAQADQAAIGHDAAFGSFRGRPDEILVATPPVDGFTFQTFGYNDLERLVSELVRAIRPDIVHVHHFIGWGVEIFELFQRAGVRVVFTLHEFAAICAQYGQMVKTDGRLCHASSPAECSLCFPRVSAGKFFVRRTILQSCLAHVDHFISPSHFLKERYQAWGLPPERISVIENLIGQSSGDRSRTMVSKSALVPSRAAGQRALVLGFFAQINPFKGLDILLEAASLLPDDVRSRVHIRVYGENRHYRDTEFDRRIQALFARVKDVVALMGSYQAGDVIALMQSCDWIVVPSIWWENSPLVMQEARIAGRPLISSNIGGMAEKINPGVDRAFAARSPGGLAQVIGEIVRSSNQPNAARLTKLAEARAQAEDRHSADHHAVYRNAVNVARAHEHR